MVVGMTLVGPFALDPIEHGLELADQDHVPKHVAQPLVPMAPANVVEPWDPAR